LAETSSTYLAGNPTGSPIGSHAPITHTAAGTASHEPAIECEHTAEVAVHRAISAILAMSAVTRVALTGGFALLPGEDRPHGMARFRAPHAPLPEAPAGPPPAACTRAR
jgi:hypothetical protein